MQISKGQKLLLGVICLMLCFTASMSFSMQADAMDYEGEEITAVDENGDVYIVEEENGSVPEDGISLYSDSGKIVNFNTKGNEVTNYTEAATGNSGYTNGMCGADAAYLGEENGKVKFMLSGVIGLVNSGEVQVVDKSRAASVSYYTVSGGRLYHYVTTNITQNAYPSKLDNGPAPSYLNEGWKYYSYDGHYFYTEDAFSSMLEDYQNGNRSRSVNSGNPFYNYYQYLPMRSRTQYSADELNNIINSQTVSSSKMRGLAGTIISNQDTYGVNGLLMSAIAANESAWGTSDIAQSKNNLFGLGAVDSSPGESAQNFADVNSCVKYFAETSMSKRYLNATNWVYSGGYVGNKASGINVRYASDPYWGEKAAAIAWRLDGLGGGRDNGRYTIGIKGGISNPYAVLNVMSGSSSGSTVLYETKNFSNMAYIILNSSPENGYYKIQSDSVLNSDRSKVDSSGNYNFGSMYGYIDANSIQVVSTGTYAGLNFTDVTPGVWPYDEVKYVYERGIMTGMNSSLFGTSIDLSRAHFVVMLHRLEGSPGAGYSTKFSDVPDGQFFSTAVMWASQSNTGVITGYDDGRFGPSDSITREQLVTMMYRYAVYRGYNVSASADLSAYPDAGSVSSFSNEAMRWAVGAGIITGDQGKLNPQGNSSRAVAATILKRFCSYYNM